jgi:hypothetical protein
MEKPIATLLSKTGRSKSQKFWVVAAIVIAFTLGAAVAMFHWVDLPIDNGPIVSITVKVFSGGKEQIPAFGDNLTITYKWVNQSVWSGDNYIESPIEVKNESGIDRILSPIQGSKHEFAGLIITIVEVHEEYVILLLQHA